MISIVGVFLPQLLFSGEDQIHAIVANPAQYGVAVLLLLAVLKPLLLGLAFKSGFLGGPTFPILFTCTMVGLALHLLFPSVPMSILVLCIEGPAIALALSAPLTAILLVSVIGTSDPETIALARSLDGRRLAGRRRHQACHSRPRCARLNPPSSTRPLGMRSWGQRFCHDGGGGFT